MPSAVMDGAAEAGSQCSPGDESAFRSLRGASGRRAGCCRLSWGPLPGRRAGAQALPLTSCAAPNTCPNLSGPPSVTISPPHCLC